MKRLHAVFARLYAESAVTNVLYCHWRLNGSPDGKILKAAIDHNFEKWDSMDAI
jgi:hypothetical protein